MPLYEGIGLISEKHAIVLDIGSAYTKAGFAGETGPRCIIPTKVLDRQSEDEISNIFQCTDSQSLHQILLDFLHLLHFKYLLVNPKDRRIVIVESVLTPTLFRDTLAKVLFLHYEVSSIVFVPSHLMTLFTLGVSSALVMDVGYQEAQIFPIYEGILMLSSGESLPLAGKALHNSIKTLLLENCLVQGPEKEEPLTDKSCISLKEHILEDIKVRTCFVTTQERGQQLLSMKESGNAGSYTPPQDLHYPFSGDTLLHIPGKIREQAAEVLFELDNDFKSLASSILDTILKSPIDMRRTLAANIVLSGGTTMMAGFKARLKSEVLKLMKHPHYQKRLAINQVKFHQTAAKENYSSWLGGAIFGATDVITTRSLTRERYLQQKYIPDWSNVSYNYNQEDEKTI